MKNKTNNKLEDVEKRSPKKNSSIISLNLFGRPHSPLRQIRKKSITFKYRLRIYCALHKPVGCAKYYHIFVISLVFLSCIAFNIFEDSFSEAMYLMSLIDLLLIGLALFHSIKQ
jgi:hypothetical protein